ncbi:hypothetical protein L596_030855 [Steinernema carpocapsae]|uniref:Uncharacterized protein n=1 Tax=Steinernema carpocapsae TaxID=34508 RepID=A0A4U5LND4_STECR|nr:hypothetical protein L596_030855 [Steinernema carpocapsae]
MICDRADLTTLLQVQTAYFYFKESANESILKFGALSTIFTITAVQSLIVIQSLIDEEVNALLCHSCLCEKGHTKVAHFVWQPEHAFAYNRSRTCTSFESIIEAVLLV